MDCGKSWIVANHGLWQIMDCGKLGLLRVVLDTNILISACLKPDGLEARVAAMAAAGELDACVTDEVLTEYKEVLGREKFRAWRGASEALLRALAQNTLYVMGGPTIQASNDEDDNRFLECAAASGAAFLITGNLRHYPPTWGCTQIVNARGFLDLYRDDRTN
jgi:putative PIN family toxin of toxin-antitoxin system